MNLIKPQNHRFKKFFNINQIFFSINVSSMILFLFLFNFYKIKYWKILIFIISIVIIYWIIYFTTINYNNYQRLDYQINQLFNNFVEEYNHFANNNLKYYQLNREIDELQGYFNEIIPLNINNSINYQDVEVEMSILNKKLQDKIQPITIQNNKNLEQINKINNNIQENINSIDQYNSYNQLIEAQNQEILNKIYSISNQINNMDNKVNFKRKNHIILFQNKNTINQEGNIDYIPIVDYSIIYNNKEISDMTYVFDQDLSYYYNQKILLLNNQDIQAMYNEDGLFVLNQGILYHFDHKFTTIKENNINTRSYNMVNGVINSESIQDYTDITYLDFTNQNNLKKNYKYNNIPLDHPVNNKFIIFHNSKYLIIVYLDVKKIYKYSKNKKIVI